MKPKTLAALLLILLCTSIEGFAAEQQHAVLLPATAIKDVLRLCSRGGPEKIDGSWQPSSADLKRIEDDLPHIAKLLSSGGRHISDPVKSFRQYVAVVIKGRRLIYINASCQEPSTGWREKLLNVCDGGECFWGALYDPATGMFLDLQTNGPH